MKRILGGIIALIFFAPVFGQSVTPQIGGGISKGFDGGISGPTSSGGGGSCSPGAHAAAFLARTSGLSVTETTAYCTLINGLDADGTFSLLDALYIFATNTTTTANLNLISTSFGLTKTGTVTFSADHGYTGDGSTGFLDTGFVPLTAGGHFSANSAFVGSYNLSNRSADSGSITVGSSTSGPGAFTIISPFGAGNTAQYDISDNTFPNVVVSSSRSALLALRTASNVTFLFQNGSSTQIASSSAASTGLSSNSLYVLAFDNSGAASNFSPDQIAATFFGGNMTTGAQAASVNNRINAYMTVLGIGVY